MQRKVNQILTLANNELDSTSCFGFGFVKIFFFFSNLLACIPGCV